ncbi:MAG: 30S ribosomal protein S5 [Parcubacteria group bacterium]
MKNQRPQPNKQLGNQLDKQSNKKNRFSSDRRRFKKRPQQKADFESRLLDVARVTRVTKGGKRFSFRATMVIGDGKGMVGVGVAQGRDVAQAMQKATQQARKASIKINIVDGTIPHETTYKYHGAIVIIKPASPGSGIKAGGAVRVVARLSGIENLTAKLIKRTSNKINIARATIEALKSMEAKKEEEKK